MIKIKSEIMLKIDGNSNNNWVQQIASEKSFVDQRIQMNGIYDRSMMLRCACDAQRAH